MAGPTQRAGGVVANSSSITLQDVLDSNPCEESSETRVLHALEEVDEEKGVSAGIFQGLPREVEHVFSTEHDVQQTSVEGTLFALTDQLKNAGGKDSTASTMNADAMDNKASGVNEAVQDQDERKSFIKSQADIFLENAEKLIEKSRADIKNRRADGMLLKTFLADHSGDLWKYAKWALLFSILPGLALSVLLFYACGNPGTQLGDEEASASWWINFVFVRNALTLYLAKASEVILIDIATPFFMKLAGPFLTLMLVQSKGWPFQLMVWGAINFAMLFGDSKFARHWLFYQDALDVFNESNSAGRVTEAQEWKSTLTCAIVIGVTVCLKRFFFSLYYGQGVFRQYGRELAIIMNKAVLIGKVAALAKHDEAVSKAQNFNLDIERLGKEDDNDEDSDEVSTSDFLIRTDNTDVYSSSGLSQSQKVQIIKLLGEWEEPNVDQRTFEKVPISAIVQFRTALSCIDDVYPFTLSFGPADKRETCIDSAQRVFLRLDNSDIRDGIVKFDTIAVVALKTDGTLSERKLKDLIRIFRPTRDGEIHMLDFVKSVDAVYKDLRVIRASIYNTKKMIAASQRILDIIFYFVLSWIVLAILGIDPTVLFGTIVGFVVGFAFMIGGASSKYFEGLLFVLVRKPYEIGDRVAVSGVERDVSGSGSSGWIVKDVDLYKTTMVFGTTNEEATYSNGSLATSRIINHNRSPKASLNVFVKFGIDVEKDKIAVFAEKVEEFVKDRPREWLSFNAFRLSNVCPDLGYVEYKVIMMHRESWQQIGAVVNSRAAVQRFAYELSKEMAMGYESPAMPIILSRRSRDGEGERDIDVSDIAVGS